MLLDDWPFSKSGRIPSPKSRTISLRLHTAKFRQRMNRMVYDFARDGNQGNSQPEFPPGRSSFFAFDGSTSTITIEMYSMASLTTAEPAVIWSVFTPHGSSIVDATCGAAGDKFWEGDLAAGVIADCIELLSFDSFFWVVHCLCELTLLLAHFDRLSEWI